jgi:hypothetical protein
MSAFLKLENFDKELIEEISAFSGHSPTLVRDVLELVFLRQIENIMRGVDFRVPYIGRVKPIYNGDVFVGGEREADVTCLFAPSELLKRIIGDINDGESDILSDLLNKKFKSALQEKLQEKVE